jgi:hypothetical protein
MSLDPDEDIEDAELSCDSCGADIKADDLFWTDGKGEVLCEKCIPPGAVPVGVTH